MISRHFRRHSRSPKRFDRRFGSSVETLEARLALAANPIISEFMASNDGVLFDGFGEASDWIEIYNAGDAAIDLAGWSLTDDAADLDKWTFPSVTLGRGEQLIVFASNEDTLDPAGYWHTNFKLDVEGEYLALVRPDGQTIATEFSPTYPHQLTDVSYGLTQPHTTTSLVAPGAASHYLVPAGPISPNWTGGAEPFSTAGWTEATTGIGFDVVDAPNEPAVIEGVVVAAYSSYNGTNQVPENAVNGSGLTVASPIENSTHGNGSGGSKTHWHTANNEPAADTYITFDLGGYFDLDEIVIWNFNVEVNGETNRGFRQFDVSFSSESIIFGAPDMNDLQLAQASGTPGETGQTIDTSSVAGANGVRFVRLDVDTNWGSTTNTGISEIRFVGALIEPIPDATITGVSIASVSSQLNATSRAADNTIDGTGFHQAYPVEASTHDAGSGASGIHWVTADGQWQNQYITYDLGDYYDLDSIVIWNLNITNGAETDRGVQDFNVSVSETNSFAGAFAANLHLDMVPAGGQPGRTGTSFDLNGATGVRFVRIDILSTWGSTVAVGLSEVRFRGMKSPVVPTSPSSGVLGGVSIEAVSSERTPNQVAVNAINGNGLTLADPIQNSTHVAATGGSQTYWHTVHETPPQDAYITFDLGALYDLDSIVIWNFNAVAANDETDRGFQQFDISVSATPDFTGEFRSNVHLNQASGTNNEMGQVIDLTGANAVRYVRLDVDANYGSTQATGLSEVRFIGSPVSYDQKTGTGSETLADEMIDENPTAYLRTEFTFSGNPADVDQLLLSMMYDDGFVAYLNGVEVARSNAPASLAFNSAATAERSTIDALTSREFNITQFVGALQTGLNMLAIQGLNSSAADPDFLILPMLTAIDVDNGAAGVQGYLATPTPGSVNSTSATALGPVVTDVSHEFDLSQNLNVVARLLPTTDAIVPASVTLNYRRMYEAELTVQMFDDGAHGDGFAGDGVYGGAIPAGTALAGEMLRYYVSALDAAGGSGRDPRFNSPTNSPQYYGTVIDDPSVVSDIAVFQWFINPIDEAKIYDDNQFTTARAAVWYMGEFYDNVLVRERGRASAGYPKPSLKFDFNPDNRLRWDPELSRVDEVNLNTTWSDKSYIRQVLASEVYRQAGVAAPAAFPVHVRQNGVFYSVAAWVEQPEEDFLDRTGLDQDGALYKFPDENELTSLADVEKKTRLDEDSSDLLALIAGIAPTNPNRSQYLWDNIDVPSVINYIAATTIMHDNDHVHKNYYMYRDTEGSGEWFFIPWDKDLTWGRNTVPGQGGVLSDVLWANQDPQSHPLFGDSDHPKIDGFWNRLIDAIHDDPVAREMYLRRLRTLMDDILQAPGTVNPELEARIDQLVAQMSNDVAQDRAKWGAPYGADQDFATATNLIKTDYLAPRRVHLFENHVVTNPGFPDNAGIPLSQSGFPLIEFAEASEIDYNPASGNQDEEYIPLTNPNAFAVDISGWRLTGGVEHTFKPGTVIPAGGTLYVSPNAAAFRARATGPSGGQGLFVQGGYQGHISNLGETIQLVAPNDSVIDTVQTPSTASPAQLYLRITEVHYNPPGSGDATEFIEFHNISTTETLDLTGVTIVDGPPNPFAFTAGTMLAPSGYLLVVKDVAAFTAAYPLVNPSIIAGQFAGSLNNSGERIKVDDALGGGVMEFRYEDGKDPGEEDWHPSTDGDGFSLAIVNPLASPNSWALGSSWRPSSLVGGSPGEADPEPFAADFNSDGQVNRADLVRLLQSFGSSQPTNKSTGDANGDQSTNLADLALLQRQFGQSLVNPSPVAPAAAAVDEALLQSDEAPNRILRSSRSQRIDRPVAMPSMAGADAVYTEPTEFVSQLRGARRSRIARWTNDR